MNILVILPLLLYVVHADSSDKQDVKTKTPSPPLNTIQQSPKYETIFQPSVKYQQPLQQQILQSPQKPHYIPVQLVPRQYLLTQPQPHAMIIIAQPALLPQSVVYGNQMQQLLNYFHSNPQAKYQLLHGNYQHQPQQAVPSQPTYTHHVVAAPTFGSYILTPAPHLQQYSPHLTAQPIAAHHAAQPQVFTQATPAAAQYSQQYAQQPAQNSQQYAQQPAQSSQQQPAQLGSIAQLAQLAAQQYLANNLKTAPAIVTGFEHFTPEQQAQIKAQLSSHLGANFHTVSHPTNQYSAKYVAEQETNDFVPSPQVKNDQVTTVSSTDILKSRYSKAKGQ